LATIAAYVYQCECLKARQLFIVSGISGTYRMNLPGCAARHLGRIWHHRGVEVAWRVTAVYYPSGWLTIWRTGNGVAQDTGSGDGESCGEAESSGNG